MEIKKIGIFTSGGDSPGMNAGIRSVVRSGVHYGYKMVGIYSGYRGIIEAKFEDFNARSVANIVHKGGTILKSARSNVFRTKEGRQIAYKNLKEHNIDALVVIGGDGSFTGAKVFMEEFNVPIVGLPGTIDNDLAGTDFTIGFDTAVNTAVEAIDKIRDTAMAHDRLFIIEVMGRHSGLIAIQTGLGSGAGSILIPEEGTDTEKMLVNLQKALDQQKLFSIVVVAEGDHSGGAMAVKEIIEQKFDQFDIKVTILGHIQRGGNPTCNDRVLATRLGYGAVKALHQGKYNVMAGIVNNKTIFTSFEDAISKTKVVDLDMSKLATILS